MRLSDFMRDDLVNVILDEEGFAEEVTYTPDGAAAGFDVVLAIGDPTNQVVQVSGGAGDQTQIGVTGRLSAIKAGILEQLAEARLPMYGDRVTFPADSAYAGVWTVLNYAPDQADGVVLTLRFESHLSASGNDAVESR